MSIPIDLSQQLSTKTLQCVLRFAEDFGIDAETSTGLAWLVEVMKLVKETSYNFPAGKYTTIDALQRILAEVAARHVGIYYGRNNH